MPERERERALKASAFLCMRRLQGVEPEEQAARDFGFGSVEAMRIQLRNWGAPEWITETAQPEKSERPKSAPPKRQARMSGPPKDLPPASGAAPLFREKLETLMRATERLEHRKEKLQGGRFVESSVDAGAVWLSRDFMSDEQWRYVSETLGLGPEAREAMHFGGATWSIGRGSTAPAEPLPALIGAYLLAGGEIEPLVQALHPDPSSAGLEKIRKRVEDKKGARTEDGIIAIAKQLATLTRGGELRRGRDPAELANHEINLASRITELREEGWADEDIYLKLRQMPNSFARELSRDEFRRLGDLGLKFPWS